VFKQNKRALIKINIILMNDGNEEVMNGVYEWFIQLKK
jgi:hypothetical protein